MEIDSDDLIKELREELEKVADAMLEGVDTWEEYIRLQARGGVLMGQINSIKTQVQNRREAEGHV